MPDHPRSRGEYGGEIQRGPLRAGSSPLSRGILVTAIAGVAKVRIIPALAGNTLPGVTSAQGRTDHPRSRGEYVGQGYAVPARGGSSPLSRGIHTRGLRGASGSGIIPALAGNTTTHLTVGVGPTDHPRSRGEYLAAPAAGVVVRGSSPLSRGILVMVVMSGSCPGIIPALAGNTSGRAMRSLPVADHPRSRGEYTSPATRRGFSLGSSPLSRGIPCIH